MRLANRNQLRCSQNVVFEIYLMKLSMGDALEVVFVFGGHTVQAFRLPPHMLRVGILCGQANKPNVSLIHLLMQFVIYFSSREEGAVGGEGEEEEKTEKKEGEEDDRPEVEKDLEKKTEVRQYMWSG